MISEELTALRSPLLEKKEILHKYNDALDKFEHLIQSNLTERKQLYCERDALEHRFNACTTNCNYTGRQDLVPSVDPSIPKEIQTRLHYENGSTNKITKW